MKFSCTLENSPKSMLSNSFSYCPSYLSQVSKGHGEGGSVFQFRVPIERVTTFKLECIKKK